MIADVIASIRCRDSSSRSGSRASVRSTSCRRIASARSRKARDHGHDVQGAPPVFEGGDLFLDDRLDRLDLALAAVHAARGHRFDVIDVEQVNALDLGDCRIDVSRHGDVDEQQPAPVAPGHDRHDVLRRRR